MRSDLDYEVWNPLESTDNYKLVEPGDFVIGLRAFQHGFSYSEVTGVVSPAYTVLRPREDLEPRFYRHYFRSDPFVSYLGELGQGIRQGKVIDYEDFGAMRLPVPSLEEQRRITDFLDDQVARIDEAVGKRLRQVDLVEESFASWLDTHLGSGAEGRRLSSLTDPSRPIQYGIVLPGPDFDGGVPIVKGGDVAAHRMEPSLLNRTDPRIEAAYPRSRLVAGDLLVAIRGSVGELATVPPSLAGANITQDAARIAPMGCDAVWLRWVLSTPTVQGRIAKMVTGATVKGINIADLRRVDIPWVTPEEQNIRGVSAEAHARRRNDLNKDLLASIELLEERKRSLITAAVTGELDVSTGSSRAAEAVVGG